MADHYQTRNWSKYNKALQKRGDFLLIIDEEVLANWHNAPRNGKVGRPLLYSHHAIESMLMLRSLFRLPLRQICGFAASLFFLLGLPEQRIPDYTTLSRRSGQLRPLKSDDRESKKNTEPQVILLDSTGVRLYSTSSWKIKKYAREDSKKRAQWRKIHVALDSHSLDVKCIEITDSNVNDCEVGYQIIDSLQGNIKAVAGDMAYDTVKTYEALERQSAESLIPPIRNARLRSENSHIKHHTALALRDKAIKIIRSFVDQDEGRAQWKKLSGYHQRSRVENFMYRYKRAFGDSLVSKRNDTQIGEVTIKCLLINHWNKIGLPSSYKVG